MQKYIQKLSLLFWPLFAIYAMAMFVLPAYQLNWDWVQIQNVWDRWQPINVGMLAFGTSIFAFQIAKYKEEEIRKREFVAARAFLPESFSEILKYNQSTIDVYSIALKRVKDKKDKCKTELSVPLPHEPKKYKTAFEKGITTAEYKVSERLALILSWMQVNRSRLETLFENFSSKSKWIVTEANIYDDILRVLYVSALINKMYGFVRNTEDFDNSDLTIEDFMRGIDLVHELRFDDELTDLVNRRIEKINIELKKSVNH